MPDTTPRLALDSSLCTLTLQLTANETSILLALLNSSDRTELTLHFGGALPAEFTLTRKMELT